MFKMMPFLFALTFAAAVAVGIEEVPLPGPGAPPTEPAPPQPTPPPPAQPTPPPLEPNPTPYPQPTPPAEEPGLGITYALGSGTVGRFKDRSFTFTPPSNLRNINALRVTCTNEKIKIKSVTVTYKNGRSDTQTALEGRYRTGEERVSYMHGVPVATVTVVARTSSVVTKDGSFRIDAAAVSSKTKSEIEGLLNTPQ